ncbi:MAG: rRNA maturation RNase YbeY [Patescibacteria group bacterium]
MFDIKNTTRKKTPKISFEKIKGKVLGKKYELSLVLIGDKLSRRLNAQYRKIDKPANILTFPLSKNTGEIFINLNLANKHHVKFNRDYKNFVTFLLIHGLMHLKGYEHSSRMEKAEEKIRTEFNI